MENVIDKLQERGFIGAMTSHEVRDLVAKPQKIYCGFDPTSDSLHLGNMVAIMGLAWFQKMGHTPVALVGGATGLVGDPSGKKLERPLLDEARIAKNLEGIEKNLRQVLDFDAEENAPIIVNNYDWMRTFSYIEFLRDVGKYFRVGPMLAKESVKVRLESEEGISFTEFSYQLIQAYDFYHLSQDLGVTIQLGGSDQWGNITAGTELIRKLSGTQTHGVTFPLLTKSDGQKFGKTEKGALWLDPEKVSPYEFYQYLYRVNDEEVIRLMRMLTFMEVAEIEEYAAKINKHPNAAQEKLAEEVTRIVHGDDGVQKAKRVTDAARPGAITELNVATLEAIAHDMPSHLLALDDLLDTKIIDLIVSLGLQGSKGEARRLIRNGGVSINNEKIDDENCIINQKHLIEKKLMLVALGKKRKVLIRVNEKGLA